MRRNQRGFTLMELLVVIVIVAILAAVAVPLYTNYVRDAYRTEGRGAISAVITAQQAYYQKNGGTSYAENLEALQTPENNYVNPQDWAANWTITTSTQDGGFIVEAEGTGRTGGPPGNIGVRYRYTRDDGGVWEDYEPSGGVNP
jgi:prepilin-type N-terminal cleavage/methylation domain-containing protein